MRSREQKNRHPIWSVRVLAPLLAMLAARLLVGRLRRVTVSGESMTPTLRPRERVVVWNPVGRPRAGQVVVYRDRFDDRLRVKRLVAIDESGLLSIRGDNSVLSTSERELGPITTSQLVGVVVLRLGSGRTSARLRYDPRQ